MTQGNRQELRGQARIIRECYSWPCISTVRAERWFYIELQQQDQEPEERQKLSSETKTGWNHARSFSTSRGNIEPFRNSRSTHEKPHTRKILSGSQWILWRCILWSSRMIPILRYFMSCRMIRSRGNTRITRWCKTHFIPTESSDSDRISDIESMKGETQCHKWENSEEWSSLESGWKIPEGSEGKNHTSSREGKNHSKGISETSIWTKRSWSFSRSGECESYHSMTFTGSTETSREYSKEGYEDSIWRYK